VFKLQDHEIINAMFSQGSLPEPWSSIHWSVSILGYIAYKAIFTSFSLGLPIPAGIYTPIFATGALIGRFFGEVLKIFGSSMEPGVFAVAAAAGLTSACTRTLATGVIVFEVIGQLEHLLPVLITVIISYAMAKSMSVSVYDLSLRVKALPYVPLMRVEDFDKTAQDSMTPISQGCMLTNSSTVGDLRKVLGETNMFNIPLVKSLNDPVILGAISRSKLEHMLENRKRKSKESASDEELMTSSMEEVKIIDEIENSPTTLQFSPLNLPELEDSISPSEEIGNEDIRINYSELNPFIDEAPFCISPKTTLHKVHYLFSMLGLGQAFVVSEGRLLGSITLHELTHPNTHCTDYTFNIL
jgi:chloride channel 2